jgi:PTH1 family peptidyl-tRNA hydrolase
VKKGGGHGGHNGLRSIDQHIGQDYWRIRIGIGHPGRKEMVEGYVLHPFAKADQIWIEPLVDAIADALPVLLAGDSARFLNDVALRTGPTG